MEQHASEGEPSGSHRDFGSTKFDSYIHLQQARVWGAPAYVLDPALQDGKKVPKWNPRSRRGRFLGMSSKHLTRVSLILNLATVYISPQYHIVHNDLYTTVPNAEIGSLLQPAHITQQSWHRLLESGYEDYIERQLRQEQQLLQRERRQRLYHELNRLPVQGVQPV